VEVESVELSALAPKVRAFYVDGMKSLGKPLTSLELDQVKSSVSSEAFVRSEIETYGNEIKSDKKQQQKDNVGSLARTIKGFLGRDYNKKLVQHNKGPQILVITSSANRATNLIRGLKAKLNVVKLRIAKLFARHIKLHQQQAFLKGGCGLAVGTPSRIQKLCDNGALDVKHSVRLVCIDMKKDVKGLNLFMLKDIEAAMLNLFHNYVYPAMKVDDVGSSSKTKICFF